MEWTNNGDRNSTFFHAVSKDMKKREMIQIYRGDVSFSSNVGKIGILAQNYSADLFAATPYYIDQNLFMGMEQTISGEDDTLFSAIPSLDEVKEAISHMNPSRSPGIDGFTGYFYSACWDIIHANMYRFIVDFFKRAYIPKEVSATTLILIPKIPDARTLGDFRPISLRNFSGKIISKYWRSLGSYSA